MGLGVQPEKQESKPMTLGSLGKSQQQQAKVEGFQEEAIGGDHEKSTPHAAPTTSAAEDMKKDDAKAAVKGGPVVSVAHAPAPGKIILKAKNNRFDGGSRTWKASSSTHAPRSRSRSCAEGPSTGTTVSRRSFMSATGRTRRQTGTTRATRARRFPPVQPARPRRARSRSGRAPIATLKVACYRFLSCRGWSMR